MFSPSTLSERGSNSSRVVARRRVLLRRLRPVPRRNILWLHGCVFLSEKALNEQIKHIIPILSNFKSEYKLEVFYFLEDFSIVLKFKRIDLSGVSVAVVIMSVVLASPPQAGPPPVSAPRAPPEHTTAPRVCAPMCCPNRCIQFLSGNRQRHSLGHFKLIDTLDQAGLSYPGDSEIEFFNQIVKRMMHAALFLPRGEEY